MAVKRGRDVRRGKPAEPESPKHVVLLGPLIGFLNLMGPAGATLLAADRADLTPLFRGDAVSSGEPIACHVLFIYCTIADNGRISGTNQSLWEVVKTCGARIAVVATANRGASLVQAMKTKNDWVANVVLTDDRNPSFGSFYKKLFQAMFSGVPFGAAWVRLAPQNTPGAPVPGSIPSPGVPGLIFGADWFPNRELPDAAQMTPVAEAVLRHLRSAYPGQGGQPHLPSLFSALGALTGYAVFQSITTGKYLTDAILTSLRNLIVEINGRDGHHYYFGELVNLLLFEAKQGRVSAWTPIAQALGKDPADLSDVLPIVKRVGLSVGSDKFAIPTLPPEYMPAERPMAAALRHWPVVEKMLADGQRPPKGWPVDLGWIIARALNDLPPGARARAAQIALEAAVPLSKVGEPPWG